MALKGWKEIPIGGMILEPGNSVDYATGSWRGQRPVVDMSRCTHCMICWVFCPDAAIEVKGGRLVGIDLLHCKGCGICAVECPRHCIAMEEELVGREVGV